MGVLHQIQTQFRNQRQKIFFKTFAIASDTHLRILDLGGVPWASFCRELHQADVTYLNLHPLEEMASSVPDNHHYISANACEIPFPDQYFDLVYCNSLLEHVGVFTQQQQVANEIRRVGRTYWVQTPYKHFPIEQHYNFPFFQYLAKPIQFKLRDHWPYSWYQIHHIPFEDEIYLLTIQEMKNLFPDAHFYYEKVGPIVKSITAFKLDQ